MVEKEAVVVVVEIGEKECQKWKDGVKNDDEVDRGRKVREKVCDGRKENDEVW